jgi:hypothetical protein
VSDGAKATAIIAIAMRIAPGRPGTLRVVWRRAVFVGLIMLVRAWIVREIDEPEPTGQQFTTQ